MRSRKAKSEGNADFVIKVKEAREDECTIERYSPAWKKKIQKTLK